METSKTTIVRMTKITTAVILAGGKGTRLGLVDRPKPMVLLDHRSLLEIQIEWLVREGITTIYLLLNHLPEVIKNEIGDGKKWSVAIHYVIETTPLGTSGALAQLKQLLQTGEAIPTTSTIQSTQTETTSTTRNRTKTSQKIDDDFYVIYGDLLCDLDLTNLARFHYKKKSDLTLVTHPNDHPYDSDLVEVDNENRVLQFLTKPHASDLIYTNLVNAAVYVFSVKALNLLENNKFQDLARDVFPRWVSQVKIYSYKTTEYLKDMGTPDRLKRVKTDLISGKLEKMSFKKQRPCVFWDRDGTLCEFVDNLCEEEQLRLRPGVANVIKKFNQDGVLNIVVTNQPGIAKGFFSEEKLRRIHKKLETLLGREHAWLDEIYYCPHHPDKGFPGEVEELKFDCSCRKPKTGMLEKAQEQFHLDLQRTVFVGDSLRDQECAQKFSIPFYGFLGGESFSKDFIGDDILEIYKRIKKYIERTEV